MQNIKVRKKDLNSIVKEEVTNEKDKMFLVSTIKKLKETNINKDIISKTKNLISLVTRGCSNHVNTKRFETLTTKKILELILSTKENNTTIYEIIKEQFSNFRLGVKCISINDESFGIGDTIALNRDSKNKDLIISNIDEEFITISSNFNPDKEEYYIKHQDFIDSIDLKKTRKYSILSTKVDYCIEDRVSIENDIDSILKEYADNILDDSIREKFLYKCHNRILHNLNEEDKQSFIIEIIKDEWNKLNLSDKTISVGDKCFYIGSYVAFKDMPKGYNLIIKDITDTNVFIEHKFIKDKKFFSLSHDEFKNKVFILSDVFEENKSSLKWSHEKYNQDILAMILSEGLLRFNNELGESFNIKNDSEKYIDDLKCVLLDRVSDMKDTITAEHYISNCLQPLTNSTYYDSSCKNRSVLDTFDTIWDNMNIGQENFIIDGKKYKKRDKIALKGYNGIKEFIISMISDGCIILSANHNGELITKKFPSVTELKKNVWKVSDIKHMEMKYINPISEVQFDKLLEFERLVNGITCNIESKSDMSYINSLSLKIAMEIKDRVDLYVCLLTKTDYLSYIEDLIRNSDVFEKIEPILANKKQVISLLKEEQFNHIESLGGVKIGSIYNDNTNFIFEDNKEVRNKFSYNDVYKVLTNSESPIISNNELEKSDLNFDDEIEIKVEEPIINHNIEKKNIIEAELKSDFTTVDENTLENSNLDIINQLELTNEKEIFSMIIKIIYENNKTYFDLINFKKKALVLNHLEKIDSNINIKTNSLKDAKIHMSFEEKKIHFTSANTKEFTFTFKKLLKGLELEQKERTKQVSFFDLI